MITLLLRKLLVLTFCLIATGCTGLKQFDNDNQKNNRANNILHSPWHSQGNTAYFEIKAEKPECPNVLQTNCLLLRQVRINNLNEVNGYGDWQIFVDSIDGYHHDYEYRRIIRVKRIKYAPQDIKGYQTKFVFDKVISSENLNAAPLN